MLKKIGIVLIVVALVIAASVAWHEYQSPQDTGYGRNLGRSGQYGRFIGRQIIITYDIFPFMRRTQDRRTRTMYVLCEWERAIDCADKERCQIILKENIISVQSVE